MACIQSRQLYRDCGTQVTDSDEKTYAIGYSEGYAYGLILELRRRDILISVNLDSPSYRRGFADGCADGAASFYGCDG